MPDLGIVLDPGGQAFGWERPIGRVDRAFALFGNDPSALPMATSVVGPQGENRRTSQQREPILRREIQLQDRHIEQFVAADNRGRHLGAVSQCDS